jgi:ParB-like chromosome segregation protein Spo0J
MQLVKISEVKPNPNNPRIIKDDKFAKLVKSIKVYFGEWYFFCIFDV